MSRIKRNRKDVVLLVAILYCIKVVLVVCLLVVLGMVCEVDDGRGIFGRIWTGNDKTDHETLKVALLSPVKRLRNKIER